MPVRMVIYLLLNNFFRKSRSNTPANNGATPLLIASQNGHLPVVERLLQEKVDPNTPANNGATPLFIASLNGHLPVVERLLQEKVNPNTPMDNGVTPLHIAILNGHLPVVERLFQEKVDPNTPQIMEQQHCSVPVRMVIYLLLNDFFKKK